MANIAQTRYHAGRCESLLGVDDSVIEAITDVWKQLASHLRQLIKHYTKPLTSGLVIGALADTTRSRADLLAENVLLRQQLIILRRQAKRPLLM
jgi:hypothetical protein